MSVDTSRLLIQSRRAFSEPPSATTAGTAAPTSTAASTETTTTTITPAKTTTTKANTPTTAGEHQTARVPRTAACPPAARSALASLQRCFGTFLGFYFSNIRRVVGIGRQGIGGTGTAAAGRAHVYQETGAARGRRDFSVQRKKKKTSAGFSVMRRGWFATRAATSV